MITAVKGNSRVVCTLGTFKEQLEPLGYRLASEIKEAVVDTASFLNKEKEEKEDKQEKQEEEDLSEKFGLKNTKTSTSKKGK